MKTFPVRDTKLCYLQKKICATIRDFRKVLVIIIWYELHCGISVYEKTTLGSIFKWLVAWKRGLPRPKFPFENLSASPTLSYTIAINKKRLQHRCFPVNIAKFLRTRILKNICGLLLLIIVIYCMKNLIKLFRNQIGLFARFHSLYQSLSHVVSRCTSRLSFYKRSQ